MAIDSGLLVDCGDLNAVGGIRQILLTDLDNIATALPTTLNATHSLTSIVGTLPWARFEFKNETASLTITGAKEGGSTSYECAVSFYIPNCDGARFLELTKLERTELMKWIEKIYEIDKMDIDQNVWKEDNSKFEPNEVNPGCYYEIKEKEKTTLIELYCGC